jgi:predicted transcriptional regulator
LAEEFISIEQDELRHVKESGWDDLSNTLGMDKSQFGLSVAKLVRVGLLRQVIGTYQSYIGDAYSITPVFRTLMKLVEKLE